MTELKQTEINFEEIKESADAPVFKLKVTNIRKSAYPTNTPAESDLFKFKVGDYIARSGGNVIYEIVSIHREPIVQVTVNRITAVSSGYASHTELVRSKELFAEYQKNGNFGACKITAKCVLRGSKEVVKGRVTKFFEIDQIEALVYNGFRKIDLPNLIKHRDYMITRVKSRLDKEQKNLDHQIDVKAAIVKLMNSKNQPSVQPQIVQAVVTQEVDLAAA